MSQEPQSNTGASVQPEPKADAGKIAANEPSKRSLVEACVGAGLVGATFSPLKYLLFQCASPDILNHSSLPVWHPAIELFVLG